MSQESLPLGVSKITSHNPGPTIALMAGVHGDEKPGVLALQEYTPHLSLLCGTLYIIYANLPAMKQNVRMVEKNINRCFLKDNDGTTAEDIRVRELMPILDKCDALLDIHAYHDLTGDPFVICEDTAMDIATKLDPELISTGWADTEPGGSDTYLYLQGKIGITLECGPLTQIDAGKQVALKVIQQFLKHFGMINTPTEFSTQAKRIIRTESAVIRVSEDFYLDPNLTSFSKLVPGKVFASQDGTEYVGKQDQYIIFPRPQTKIGTEAFTLGREIVQ